MFEKFAAKAGALAVIVLIALAVGGVIGDKVSDVQNGERIATLETQLGAARNAETLSTELAKRFSDYCGAIDAATQKQDAAIDALGKLAEAHEAAAAEAVARARSDSAAFQRDAAVILGKPAPAGVDACAAASAEFDKELRAERRGAKPR